MWRSEDKFSDCQSWVPVPLYLVGHLHCPLFPCFRWGLSKRGTVRCLFKVTQTDPLCSTLRTHHPHSSTTGGSAGGDQRGSPVRSRIIRLGPQQGEEVDSSLC